MSTGAWVAVVVGGWYAFWSVVSVLAYGSDKFAAIKGWRRIRERRLHEIDLLGGWPGGLLAQNLFRHKRRKGSFMRWVWVIVGLHVALWIVALVLLVRWLAQGG